MNEKVGVIRTDMTKAVVKALRDGTPEVYVPREVGLQGRLFTTAPARLADRPQRLTGADRVMQ